jgi:FkbH-like protein
MRTADDNPSGNNGDRATPSRLSGSPPPAKAAPEAPGMEQREVFKAAQALRKQGRVDEALGLLRSALRARVLDSEGIDKAGRTIRTALEGGSVGPPSLRVWLLGQCTTSWLVSSLTAVAWGQNQAVWVAEGGYDTVVQELLNPPEWDKRPDVVVLIPWGLRLLAPGDRAPADRIDEEIAFWQQAWALTQEKIGTRLLQVGYDWVVPGPRGHHLGGAAGGDVDLVRQVNAALRAHLPQGAYFLDLEQVAGEMGRETFYNPRRYYWTKQPFSEAGTVRLTQHLWAGIRALTTGPKKVLVLDLDNTLWGGVVGETGPLGISLGESPDGEAYRAFQEHVKGLGQRGVVLAVASKNNPEDGREPFVQNPNMVLRLDDFAALEIGWDPKAVMIERIAETLNLGLDSFVFFDDNPAERENVRQAHPAVAVVEAPEDPAEYVRALQAGLWFEAAALTEADRERAGQYAAERSRREHQQSFASTEDYLRSLNMQAEVRVIDEADMQRVVQLLAKTNQFNLTTRRHSHDELRGLMARPRSLPLTLRVSDKFGDHGLVAVLLAMPVDGPESDAARIDTWLMSCRVIGRTVEHFFLGDLLDRAAASGYRRLIGEFIPTKKNTPVQGLYEGMGFRLLPDVGDGVSRWELDLRAAARPTTFVRQRE